MASTPSEEPTTYTVGETARMVGLAFRITRREARGKSTARLERRADRIQEQAEERKAAAAKARRK
ncbi:DUF6257 family protein [Streptomyces sp. NPDC090119]|uniref:DUF6257 family protein n=1 Tax=Streptomyces sp. NPDC090119 TaxID=3365951 RepID=UPI0038115E3E